MLLFILLHFTVVRLTYAVKYFLLIYRLNAVPAQATVWKHWIELGVVDPAKKSSHLWLYLFLIHQQTHG